VPHDRVGEVVVGDEVQDRDEGETDRLGEIESLPHLRGGQQGLGLAHVGADVGGAALRAACHAGTGMGEHGRVVVDVDDPRLRDDRLHHLVQVG
jgi:hypothetical protein